MVQVKFIENNEKNPPPRNTDETVNGLRFGVYNGSCNPFIKQQGSEPESEAPSLNFIEKICAIDDLCLNDISLQESKINSDSHAPAKFGNSEKVAHNSNFHSELLSTTVSKKTELAISPVIEEASRISNNETDTASEISEIPSDEEKEREEERKPEDDKKRKKINVKWKKKEMLIVTLELSKRRGNARVIKILLNVSKISRECIPLPLRSCPDLRLKTSLSENGMKLISRLER